uniref:Uncharacterized protein n=1 Tax=Oryza rufipogon TaxID=4529 RepID=A0A0E0MQC2_ORYRU
MTKGTKNLRRNKEVADKKPEKKIQILGIPALEAGSIGGSIQRCWEQEQRAWKAMGSGHLARDDYHRGWRRKRRRPS